MIAEKLRISKTYNPEASNPSTIAATLAELARSLRTMARECQAASTVLSDTALQTSLAQLATLATDVAAVVMQRGGR